MSGFWSCGFWLRNADVACGVVTGIVGGFAGMAAGHRIIGGLVGFVLGVACAQVGSWATRRTRGAPESCHPRRLQCIIKGCPASVEIPAGAAWPPLGWIVTITCPAHAWAMPPAYIILDGLRARMEP